MGFNLSVTAQDLNEAVEKANAAAPQATTYTKTEVDTALAAKLNTADVDASLSSTSTNPVQNKAVQAAITERYTKSETDTLLSGKQPALTTAQQAAVDSGITSAKIQQFEGKADAPVESYITEESQLDEISQGTIMALLGTTVAGYETGTWAVIRTYYLNAVNSRRLQIIEHQNGDRKVRFYKDAWGSWT